MSIIRTILHKLHLISKMKRYMGNSTAISINKSMLLPYFDYADIIFDKANAGSLKKLQTLQNKCLKPIFHQNAKYLASGTFGVT